MGQQIILFCVGDHLMDVVESRFESSTTAFIVTYLLTQVCSVARGTKTTMRPQIRSFAESDSDEEEDGLEIGLLYMVFQQIHNGRARPRAHWVRIRGPEIVLDCFNDDRHSMNACRMPSDCLRLLMQKIVGVYEHQANGYRIPIQEQLIVTLSYLAHAGTMSGTGTFFGYSRSGAAKVVERMLKPLGRLFREELLQVDQNYIHPKLKATPVRQIFQASQLIQIVEHCDHQRWSSDLQNISAMLKLNKL